jgi:amino acid transporter
VIQALAAATIALLGQAGSSVRAAYDVLVGMGVITYFVPFLLMFAAAIRLKPERAGVGPPRLALVTAAALGFLTTAVSAILAAFPPGEGGWLAATKIVGGSVFLAALGAVLYLRGRAGRPA